jgi:hypothetical protein
MDQKLYVGTNIGIGITNPRRQLDVLGEIVTTNRVTFAQDTGVATKTWHIDNSGNDLRVFQQANIDAGGNVYMTLKDGGNLGIGNALPSGKLEVGSSGGASDPNIVLDANDATSEGGQINFRGAGTNNDIFMDNYSGALRVFFVSATDKTIQFFNADATGKANFSIEGALTKGSGTFDIESPDPEKAKDGWRLRHSFVESPTRGDNIYRWTVEVKNKTGMIDLPGYFRFLNENCQVWVSPVKHFGRAYGEINSDYTSITITADADGTYNVLAVGTRKDDTAKHGFDTLGLEYKK